MNNGIGSSGKRSLIIGFMNGRVPKTYLQKDYEQLQLAISQANNESKRSERKIGAIEKANHAAIEHQMDAMHQRIWLKEWERLSIHRARFQRDLDEVLQLISLIPRGEDRTLIEVVEQQEQLEEAVLLFQQSTLTPIDEFCADIQYWVKNRRRDSTLGQDPSLIRDTFLSLKEQQGELLGEMEEEQKQLERMLRIRNLQAEFEDEEEDLLAEVDDGECISTARSDQTIIPNRLPIPDDILESNDCEVEVKEMLLHEFVAMDDSFHEQLRGIYVRIRQYRGLVREFEDQMAIPQATSLLQVVVNENNNLLKQVDPWKLVVLEGVYRRAPQDLPKSWYLLYIHFLHLMYPKQQRWQLSQGASLVHQYMALKKRARIVTADWRRAHGELIDRIRDMLAQLAEKQREANQRFVDMAEQKKLCSELSEQVNNWRRLKMEEAQLQHELDMAKMAQEAEKLAAVAEREKELTRMKKEKIAKFKDEKAQKRLEEMRKAEERLAEVKRQLAEHAEIDWERIKFRKVLFEEKVKLAEEKVREAEAEDAKKEERLEALRRLVRVEAPSNLVRTMGDTETWKNHDERYLKMIRAEMKAEDDLWEESKPLFTTPGYSAKQVMGDKRVQLEQRLRETGLIASEYGRKLIAQMKPPTVTRRDQLGSLGVGDLLPPAPAGRPLDPYLFQPTR